MAKKKASSGYTRAQVEALQGAAAADVRGALVELAALYDDGDARDRDGRLLVKRNPSRARRYYARAAELGDPAAITVMADHLTSRGHDPRALAEAEKLYRRAF